MKNKKALLGAAALIAVALLFLLAYRALAPRPVEGAKEITLQIVHGDGTTRDLTLHTDAQYLGDALDETEGLVEGEEGPYGLYIKTADGETASDADRTWWRISKDGVECPNSADRTVIADGEQYELTLMTY